MKANSKQVLTLLTASMLTASACSSMNKGTAIGAGAGAATGAAIGGIAGGGKGAAIGGAAGGLSGAAIGTYLAKQEKELQKVVPTTRTDEGLKINLSSDILFPFDSANLKPDAKETLSKLADIFEKYERDQLKILGFTDYIGSKSYNQELSEKRAENVKEFLAAQGVSSERIEAIGKGEAPDKATTPEGRHQNRRVEILITVPEKKQA